MPVEEKKKRGRPMKRLPPKLPTILHCCPKCGYEHRDRGWTVCRRICVKCNEEMQRVVEKMPKPIRKLT